MEEFTPETLKKYITHTRNNRNVDEIINSIEKSKKANLEQNTNTDISLNIATLDSQIRNNLVEIIRRLIRNNQKDELKKILEEHKNFIQNILDILP